jgi:thiol-disulfide isomerase/thioredoxin
MKNIVLIIIASILYINIGVAQSTVDSASMPLYLKTRIVPSFKILKLDSTSYFYKYQLKKQTATIVVYFSPDCDHCQHEAIQMVDSAKLLRNAQIVFISTAPLYQIKNFAEKYKLTKLKNTTVGRDERKFISHFFKSQYVPFVALYNKDGNLIQGFDGGTSVAQMVKLLKQ